MSDAPNKNGFTAPKNIGLKNEPMSGEVVRPETLFSDRLQTAWRVIEKSRHPQRPYTLDYINSLCSEFEELKGDRRYGEDPALIAGIAKLKSTTEHPEKTIFVLGHQKGRNTKQKIARNFGMAKPEGYRKAMRVMDLAERFKKPLLTFIDTPGAYPGVSAEERGQSEAIAASILHIFRVKVPTIGIVIGEGGSGGALAIGVTDKLWMMENSTYSVISPESCAAILWGNAAESKRAALALKLTAKDAVRLGVSDHIISEPREGAHESFNELAPALLGKIQEEFSRLGQLSIHELVSKRFEKYRRLDGLSK